MVLRKPAFDDPNGIIPGDLTVQGNLAVTGDITYEGNETVSGNETVTGNLTVGGDASVGDDLTVTGDIDTDGDVLLSAIGKSLKVLAGANGKAGTVTLNGATPVSVATTALKDTSVVLFGLKTVGGTVGAYPSVKTVTPNTGFDVAGTAGDTSVYNWIIVDVLT